MLGTSPVQPFRTLDAIAAPLPLTNVDTDQILTGRFLKTVGRDGLGEALFYAMRYRSDGTDNAGFILNREPYRQAQILVALDNFGCGSSREHAPWALFEFGVRCIIAPSFADIFYSNCTKNGLLPVTLKPRDVEKLLGEISEPARCRVRIDLSAQSVTSTDYDFSFDIDSGIKQRMLHGVDDISQSLLQVPAIEAFEQRRQAEAYLYPPISALDSII
jgi:3-isopropylmalate/(R)-2-methylmalate dehydratase small subunit